MSFVEFKNVYKRYKMGEVTITAVDGISFEIEQGEFAVVVGNSGAGKTTVIKMLTGILKPTEGSAVINGFDIVKEVWTTVMRVLLL